MAVPMGSSAEVVIFGGFRRGVASFRVAGVALRDIQTCSGTCRKSFCVAGAILSRRFHKMSCIFRGRRSTLDVSIVIFRGRRSTLDVSCCVFFVNRIGRAASSGDNVQIPWQAWHFVRCVENWRKPRTKHRFEVANFQVLRKTRRKTSILKLQSVKIGGGLARNARFGAPTCLVSRLWFSRGLAVSMGEAAKLVFLLCCQLWKLEEVSYEMLVFCIHVSCLESLVCLWRRRVYGGSWKTCPFRMFPSRLSRRFAWQCDIPTCLITCGKCQNWRKSRTKCCFFAPTCLVSSRSFSGGVAVSIGEAAKLVFLLCCHLWKLLEVSYEMLVFCIHVSCLESLVCLWRRRVYGGSWKTCPFRMFPSRLSRRFAWQAWHFVTFQPVW